MKKIYSGYENLPEGTASEHITDGCLVLEGGAFRGLYTQGFLDALMESDINMACVIGVSAGALSAMNYVSGQIGRSARINLGFRHDSRYVGTRALVHSHSILDISFLTEDRGILEPFDRERFENSKQRFIAVATNCDNGKAVCFEKGRSRDIMEGVRASATMPYISPMVWIGGVPYLDGGCTCKI
ncbi:MAG: patatin family protein, partial [Lachnospiraceae bacterium]|nr:patatin family protein [Lachnospiraceae bacterium]